jgi:hypothetical protein
VVDDIGPFAFDQVHERLGFGERSRLDHNLLVDPQLPKATESRWCSVSAGASYPIAEAQQMGGQVTAVLARDATD